MGKACLYMLTWCIVALSGLSQYQPNPFRVINRSQGLPSPLIHRVYETSDGFLWVATQTGLARFDGRNFEMIYAYYSDSNSITANIVTDLQEDAEGQLWIGSFTNGLSIYNLKTGKWKQIKAPTADANPVYSITDIFRDDDNQIWVGTGGRGLLQYDAKKQVFIKHLLSSIDGGVKRDRYANSIRRIAADPDEKQILWLAAMDGLYRFDKKSGKLEKFENIKNGIKYPKDNSFHAICAPKGNLIWTGAWGGGIASFDKRSKSFIHYPIDPNAYNQQNHGANIVYDLYPVSDTTLYVASYDAGLQEFDIRKKTYTPVITNETGVSQEEVRPIQSICTTSNGCLWVCGINAIYLKHNVYNRLGKWQALHRVPDQQFKYPAYLSSVIWQPHSKTYWMAAQSVNGILEYHSNLQFIRSIPVENWENREADFTRLQRDKKGRTWLQVRSSQWLHLYDSSTNSFRLSSRIKGREIVSTSIAEFIIDSSDRIWMVSDSALLMYQPDAGIYRKYKLSTSENSLIKLPVKYATIVCDRKGTIWIGSNIGLWKFDAEKESLTHLVPGSTTINSLANANISSLAVDREGNCWVAPFSEGIQVYDVKSGKFTKSIHVSIDPNFHAPQVNFMQFDNLGKLWACTTNGLGLWDPGTGQWEWFDKKDGLIKDYVDQPICITENGMGFLTQQTGFIAFPTNYRIRNEFVPRTRITALLIDGVPQNKNEGTNDDRLRIRQNQKQITIRFTAIEPIHPERVQFYYKLDGLDKEWLLTNQHEILYGGLPTGNYTFRLKARNSDGVWSNELTLGMMVMGPFWKKWWFIALVLLSIVLVFYAIYRYRLQQILRMQQLRNNISRNLHDEIGSSVSSINMLSEVARLKIDQQNPVVPLLQEIGVSAQQAGESIDEIIWSVNPSHDAAAPTFNRIRNHVSQLLEKVGVEYTIELPDLPPSAKLGMELRRDTWMICKEAVNNLLKYAHCKNAKLSIEWKNDYLNIHIEDDGRGFNVQEAVNGQRNGLKNMEARVKKYKGGIFEIDSAPGKGTRIYCRIPLKK